MPSYSCCARRIVTAAEYPSCLAASCCSVLVRNGGGAGRRRSPFSSAVTLKGSLSASATIAWAVAASLISGLWPSSLCSLAWNPWPSFSRSASMVQYSCGTNLRISSSRSQISRDRKSTRLNSSHVSISYAVFCLKKKKKIKKHIIAPNKQESTSCIFRPETGLLSPIYTVFDIQFLSHHLLTRLTKVHTLIHHDVI